MKINRQIRNLNSRRLLFIFIAIETHVLRSQKLRRNARCPPRGTAAEITWLDATSM